MNTEFSLTLVLATFISESAMEGASDTLMADKMDIVDKAQELAKSKISKLPIVQNQLTGPPTITNPPVGPATQSSMEGKSARKSTQQYADIRVVKTEDKSNWMQGRSSGRKLRWSLPGVICLCINSWCLS